MNIIKLENIGTLHTSRFLQPLLASVPSVHSSCQLIPAKVRSDPNQQQCFQGRCNSLAYIHMVLELCLCDMQLFQKVPYYASIMPLFKSCRFCSKLCQHNICKPSPRHFSVVKQFIGYSQHKGCEQVVKPHHLLCVGRSQINRCAMLSQRVQNQYYQCLTPPTTGIGSSFINQFLMVSIEIT